MNNDAPAVAPAPRQSRVMRWVFLSLAMAALVGCDQATKLYAVEHFEPEPAPREYLGGVFKIVYAENTGAFLSLMSEWSPRNRFLVLTLANGIVLLLVGAYLVTKSHIDRWSLVAFTLILAGGVGNLIDRVRLNGIVIDFLNIDLGGPLKTGIFNVADIAITAGFVMLLIQTLRGDRLPDEPTAAQPAVN